MQVCVPYFLPILSCFLKLQCCCNEACQVNLGQRTYTTYSMLYWSHFVASVRMTACAESSLSNDAQASCDRRHNTDSSFSSPVPPPPPPAPSMPSPRNEGQKMDGRKDDTAAKVIMASLLASAFGFAMYTRRADSMLKQINAASQHAQKIHAAQKTRLIENAVSVMNKSSTSPKMRSAPPVNAISEKSQKLRYAIKKAPPK